VEQFVDQLLALIFAQAVPVQAALGAERVHSPLPIVHQILKFVEPGDERL